MSQIQAASASALPQQASKSVASTASTNTPSSASTLDTITEKLGESNQAGDRDAQEQYLGSKANKLKNPQDPETNEPTAEDPAASIWNLSVADDSPPPDLDIRG